MQSLDNIKIKIEASHDAKPSGLNQALPVLNEILQVLDRFSESGTAGLIDVGTLPLDEDEIAFLDEFLGRGEVCATVKVFGESQIYETGVAGVWRVRHRNEAGKLVADHIEVCAVPTILASSSQDIVGALEVYRHKLKSVAPSSG